MGLIARHVEALGISTLCMSSALDITKAVNPPRAAFLDFPSGHTTGKPHEPALQREILIEALNAFASLTETGSIKLLPFQWSEDSSWKETAMAASNDNRLPRYDTPQYQNEEDRLRAEGKEPSACAVCNLDDPTDGKRRG